jgi:hypothetical protein
MYDEIAANASKILVKMVKVAALSINTDPVTLYGNCG